jgi:hypothetical protein
MVAIAPIRRASRKLREAALPVRAQRVDRERGIIYGVKILGLESRNKRRYLPEAIRKAIPLYEGAKVKRNHTRSPNADRDPDDTVGWLESVRQDEKGELYGDLHLLNPAGEFERKVMSAAELKPDLYGLSHDADGDWNLKEGWQEVYQITDVASVDLVDKPATNDGLFESEKPMLKLKLREWADKVKLEKPARKILRRLIEAGYMDGDSDVDTGMEEAPADDAPAEDHTAMLRAGFAGSCGSIVDQALDGEMDPKEALKKLKELINTHSKLRGSDDDEQLEEDDEEETDDELEECEDDDMKKKESYRTRVLKARKLCEAMKVDPDFDLVEAVAALPDDASRRRLVEREKKKAPAGPDRRPRSQAAGSRVTESDDGVLDVAKITDGAGFARALGKKVKAAS